MIGRLIRKTVRGVGILLALTAVVTAVIALRLELYIPELLSDILRAIGG